MYKLKMKFSCNAGHTEEIVDVDIYNEETEESELFDAFHKWLDNNEQVGFEYLDEDKKHKN